MSWANKYVKGDSGKLEIVLEENLAESTEPWVLGWAPTRIFCMPLGVPLSGGKVSILSSLAPVVFIL